MDPEWLGTLLDQHAPALELYARQWCGTSDAQDVVQDAFFKLTSQRPRPDHPAAWLFRVVRNGAIKSSLASRRRRRHESTVAESTPWFEDGGQGGGQHKETIDPEAAAEAMRRLPIEQREVIVAHLWGGLTFEQVAELCGSSSSTVHRLYQSGLKALRDCLGVPCPTTSRATRSPK